jgi:hypothetical protein
MSGFKPIDAKIIYLGVPETPTDLLLTLYTGNPPCLSSIFSLKLSFSRILFNLFTRNFWLSGD